MRFSKIVFCIAVSMVWGASLYAQSVPAGVPAQERVSRQKEAVPAADTAKGAAALLPETTAVQSRVPVSAEASPGRVGSDKTGKRSVSDWSSFWGAVLGAVISASAAIFVFWRSNRVQRRDRRRMLKVSFGVILELLEQTVLFLERFMEESKQIEEHRAEFRRTGKVTRPLPFKVPYALERLGGYDMGLFAEVMAEFRVEGYPQMLACIDHACHYIGETNKYFEQKYDELRDAESVEKADQVYGQVVDFVTEKDGMQAQLGQIRDRFMKFREALRNRECRS